MTPPRWIERLLAGCIPEAGASGHSLLGDLAEEYVELRGRRGRWLADGWYLAQALAIGAQYRLAAVPRWIDRARHGAVLDLRSSIRALRRSPGLVIVGVTSLAGGVGLTTAAVSLVYAIWFAPLPWTDAHRLVDLEDVHPVEVCAGCSPGTSYDAWLDWRELAVFETTAAFESTTRRLGDAEAARDVQVGAMAGDGFGVLDLPVALGRGLTPADGLAGSARVAVLSHAVWMSVFGGAPEVVGRPLHLDGVPHTVVGVLDPAARPLDRSRVWVPLDVEAVDRGFAARGLWVIARLADGVSLDRAQEVLAEAATSRFAADPTLEPGWTARATPLRDVLLRSAAQPSAAAALVATTVVVLLITTLNLTSLLVARVTEREAEFGLRSALGAGRSGLARAAVLEALLLSLAGGGLGVFGAFTALTALARRFQAELPGWVLAEVDLRVLSLAVAVVVTAALATSLLPVVRVSDMGRRRGMTGRLVGSGSPARLRTHDALLAMQVTLGVVLVAGSLSALRTYSRVSDFDTLGHRWRGITSVGVALPLDAPGDGAPTLRAALSDEPGIEKAALTRALFLGSWGREDAPSPVWVDGRPEAVPNAVVPRHSLAVSTGYFDLFEIPIVRGRPIDDSDRPGGAGAAVVSRAAARTMWPGVEPTELVGAGFSIRNGAERTAFTVVGIAADVVVNPGSESRRAGPRIYVALGQFGASFFDASPQSELVAQIVERGAPRAAQEWDTVIDRALPGAVVTHVTTVEAGLRRWVGPARITGWAFAGLAALALVLLALGVYGTVSYRMASSRRELGIRVALGARPARLVGDPLRGLARVLGLALSVGLVAAYAIGGGSAGGLPVGTDDVGTMAVVALVLIAVATVASLVPVRRALSVDPVQSLRSE